MDKILRELKRHRPALARVTLVDGEQRDVSLEGGRQRWTPAAKVISKLPWVRIELLDAKERLKGSVENDGAASDLEEIGTGNGGREGTVALRELHLLKLLMTGQDVALQRQAELFKPVLDAMRFLMGEMMTQTVAARKHAASQTEAAAELAEKLAELAGRAEERGEGGLAADLVNLAGALPGILGAVGAASKMLGAGVKPATTIRPARPRTVPRQASPAAPATPAPEQPKEGSVTPAG